MRYVFCINAGRSGSNYLAALLGTAAGVAAFHEAEPTMHGAPLHRINDAPLSASYAERRVKLDGIAALVAAHPWAHVYAETNHMFIKTFHDVVLEELKGVEVIHLRRDPARVLKSFIELGYFSPLNSAWREWMSSPNAATAAARAPDRDAALDQYDRCIAYLHDIEARGQRLRRDYPDIPVHEVALEDIVDPRGGLALFESLRLTPTPQTAAFVGTVVNERAQVKQRIANRTDLGECRRRLDEYAARTAIPGGVPTAVAPAGARVTVDLVIPQFPVHPHPEDGR